MSSAENPLQTRDREVKVRMEGGVPAGRKQERRVSIGGADAREQKSPEDTGPPHDGHRSSRQ